MMQGLGINTAPRQGLAPGQGLGLGASSMNIYTAGTAATSAIDSTSTTTTTTTTTTASSTTASTTTSASASWWNSWSSLLWPTSDDTHSHNISSDNDHNHIHSNNRNSYNNSSSNRNRQTAVGSPLRHAVNATPGTFFCVLVCMFICLKVCLLACLLACLLVCLSIILTLNFITIRILATYTIAEQRAQSPTIPLSNAHANSPSTNCTSPSAHCNTPSVHCNNPSTPYFLIHSSSSHVSLKIWTLSTRIGYVRQWWLWFIWRVRGKG